MNGTTRTQSIDEETPPDCLGAAFFIVACRRGV